MCFLKKFVTQTSTESTSTLQNKSSLVKDDPFQICYVSFIFIVPTPDNKGSDKLEHVKQMNISTLDLFKAFLKKAFVVPRVFVGGLQSWTLTSWRESQALVILAYYHCKASRMNHSLGNVLTCFSWKLKSPWNQTFVGSQRLFFLEKIIQESSRHRKNASIKTSGC